MSKLIDELDQASLRNDVPAFRPGDSVKVHVKVVEGNRSRIQVFAGVVISRAGDGVREAFTVRKVSFGVGVERTFPVHSPIIDKIEVDRRGDVRRAKLYYLRGLRGKAAKIKEKRDAELSRRGPSGDRRSRDALPGDRAMPAAGWTPHRLEPCQRLTFGQHVGRLRQGTAGGRHRRGHRGVAAARLRRTDVPDPVISMENTLQVARPGRGREAQQRQARPGRGLQGPGRLAHRPASRRARAGRQGVPVRRRAARHQHRAPDQAGGRRCPATSVVCCDQQGRITVNGQPLDETSYLYTDRDGVPAAPSTIRFDVVVPAGRIFVLGDNRERSRDSRCHLNDVQAGGLKGENAFVSEDLVVGRAIAVVWPFDRTAPACPSRIPLRLSRRARSRRRAARDPRRTRGQLLTTPRDSRHRRPRAEAGVAAARSRRQALSLRQGAADRRGRRDHRVVAAAGLRRPDVHHPVAVDGEHPADRRPGRGAEDHRLPPRRRRGVQDPGRLAVDEPVADPGRSTGCWSSSGCRPRARRVT